MAKTKLSMSLDGDLLRKIDAVAAEQKRSRSNLVQTWLIDRIEKSVDRKAARATHAAPEE